MWSVEFKTGLATDKLNLYGIFVDILDYRIKHMDDFWHLFSLLNIDEKVIIRSLGSCVQTF